MPTTLRQVVMMAAALAVMWGLGCRSMAMRPAPTAHRIAGVPFHADDSYQCGPACLAGVLGYWQVPVTQQDIAERVFSPSARGTLGVDLAWYAREQGLAAGTMDGTLDYLHRLVDDGMPAIVMVDYAWGPLAATHYMVVTGYDEQGVIVNSGMAEADYLSNDRFLRLWQRCAQWMLVIAPRERHLPW
jgi:ABC-type bacteriocin/lantibiotic exporter with double-glycine peptidase domain